MSQKSKPYPVSVSPRATDMLVSHARFLARVSENAAMDLIAEFEEKAESLSTLPDRNPWLDDPLIPERKYRKLLLKKRYLMLYQVKAERVYIEYVVDCRQDYQWLIW